MNSKDYAYCRKCRYCSKQNAGGSSYAVCEYMEATGRPRSKICPPGVGCTERVLVESKRGKHKPMFRSAASNLGIRKAYYTKIDKDEAMRLYNEGLNDNEIARRFGCSATAVAFWRKSYNLASNYDPHAPRSKK